MQEVKSQLQEQRAARARKLAAQVAEGKGVLAGMHTEYFRRMEVGGCMGTSNLSLVTDRYCCPVSEA